jgi:two-component system LytT family sensor kinase
MRRAQTWTALLVLAAFTAIGLLQFTHYYLNVLAAGRAESFRITLIEEMTGAYGGAVLFFPIAWLARRAHEARWSALRIVGLHAAILPVFSVFHTSWNWATRAVIFPLAGLGPYDYGRMPLRYAMELPTDVLFYALIMGLFHLFLRYRESRDRELHVARLEAELGRARLEVLESQLHPHFLFNVLNTISAVMYENVAVADRMLARLGDLLRHTLRRPVGTEVAIAEELETLELYLEIMRARFAERLCVRVCVAPEAMRARVPPLLLQPLVENAIVHGEPPPGTAAEIVVAARRDAERLVLTVEDNGPGLAAATRRASSGHGIGLGATTRRLEHLYGERAGVTLENAAGGGVRAVVSLPFREAP